MTTRTSDLTVLVDAENVRRSRWPNVGREELIDLCRDWAQRRGYRAIVVFDGRAPRGGSEDHCLVIGSEDASADDVLARTASDLGASGKRHWLVTSDRELRTRAGGKAERTIGGGAFLRELDA